MVRAWSCSVVGAHLACRERADGDPLRRGNMAGSQANRPRRGGHVVGLAVMFLALGATARAQGPGLPIPAPPGEFASMVNATEPTMEPLSPQPLVPAPSIGAGGGPVPIAPRVEMGLFDT